MGYNLQDVPRRQNIYNIFFISILHGLFINDVTVLRGGGCIISDVILWHDGDLSFEKESH